MGKSRGVLVSAALVLTGAISLLPLQVAGAQSPSTGVLVPASGATLSGSTYLDASASDATSVEFLLFGGTYGYDAPVVCTATLSYYGWLCSWNTTTVANGSYALVSKASGGGGAAFSGSAVSITVNNPPPSTTVLVPASGATWDTAGYLVVDAGASPGVSTVSIKVTTEGFVQTFSTTPTIYGWIAFLTETGASCGDGCSPLQESGAIQSVASYSGGVSGTSPPVNITEIFYFKTPP